MKIGDVVRLKSGGPKMTVIALDASSEEAKENVEYASVAWLNQAADNSWDDSPNEASLPVVALEAAP